MSTSSEHSFRTCLREGRESTSNHLARNLLQDKNRMPLAPLTFCCATNRAVEQRLSLETGALLKAMVGQDMKRASAARRKHLQVRWHSIESALLRPSDRLRFEQLYTRARQFGRIGIV
jgi:hypothetical protein